MHSFVIHAAPSSPQAPITGPAPTSYTLSDIYTRLTTNGAALNGNHDFTPPGPPDTMFHNLSQVYAAIPTIDANRVASGTSYLGVDGTLIPDGGSASHSDVISGKTYFGNGQTNWTLQTGTMPNNGQQVFTPSTSNQTIQLGFHDGTGYVIGDSDLIANNIKGGVNLFGVNGTMVANPLFGDVNDASKVLTTASNSGTYDASNLTPENVRNGITYGAGETGTFTGNLAYGDDDPTHVLTNAATAGTFNVSHLSDNLIAKGVTWGVGLGNTGLMTGDTNSSQVLTTAAHAGTFDVSGLSNDVIANGVIWGDNAGATGAMFGDTSSSKVLTSAAYAGTYNASHLSVGTVQNGVAFGAGLTGSYPSSAYPLPGNTLTADLAGNGSKITSSNGTVEWWKSDGTRQNATLDFPAITSVCSNASVNTAAGTLTVNPVYLAVGNTYCGTAGTLLKDLFNGTAGPPIPSGGPFPGGDQANGGVDDYNNGYASGPTAGRYVKGWTQCLAGNGYCGTGDSSSAYKDDSTNLIWSQSCMGSGGTCSPGTGTPTVYNWSDARNACSNMAGWSLPHQKQLMQAYIDGSYGNLEPRVLPTPRYYWSSTTGSNDATMGWSVDLSRGYVVRFTKTTSSANVRCVRLAP